METFTCKTLNLELNPTLDCTAACQASIFSDTETSKLVESCPMCLLFVWYFVSCFCFTNSIFYKLFWTNGPREAQLLTQGHRHRNIIQISCIFCPKSLGKAPSPVENMAFIRFSLFCRKKSPLKTLSDCLQRLVFSIWKSLSSTLTLPLVQGDHAVLLRTYLSMLMFSLFLIQHVDGYKSLGDHRYFVFPQKHVN